jgi:hypothetical protein
LLIVLRGIGVAFVVLMMLDALTGRLAGRWQLVSAFGAYYVWGAFVVGFAKRIALDPCSSLPLALLVLALIPNLLTARLVGTRK